MIPAKSPPARMMFTETVPLALLPSSVTFAGLPPVSLAWLPWIVQVPVAIVQLVAGLFVGAMKLSAAESPQEKGEKEEAEDEQPAGEEAKA